MEKIKVLEVKTNHLFKHPEEILQFQLESFRESLSKTVELLIEEHMSTFLSKMSQKLTKCEVDFQSLKNSLQYLANRQKKIENEFRFTNTSEILEKDYLSALSIDKIDDEEVSVSELNLNNFSEFDLDQTTIKTDISDLREKIGEIESMMGKVQLSVKKSDDSRKLELLRQRMKSTKKV